MTGLSQRVLRAIPLLEKVVLIVGLFFYLGYLAFIISSDRGPVDYETFMSIGQRFVSGAAVYGENSYYPMPYVMIFGLASMLPRPASMALWLFVPVICALLISRGKPWVLFFAPLAAHFLGGQTALFGMVGLWAYRRSSAVTDLSGGIALGLTSIKPQLGLIPTLWAFKEWFNSWRSDRKIPRQFWGWLGTVLILYLPGFFFLPDWVQCWLTNPRPLFPRALSGLVPRSLLSLFPENKLLFWGLLLIAAVVLMLLIRWRTRINLDILVLWWFIFSPIVHDYDLIQLIPLLDTPVKRQTALLAGIPLWVVLLFYYANDAAWFAVTLIAPAVLFVILSKKTVPPLLSSS